MKQVPRVTTRESVDIPRTRRRQFGRRRRRDEVRVAPALPQEQRRHRRQECAGRLRLLDEKSRRLLPVPAAASSNRHQVASCCA